MTKLLRTIYGEDVENLHKRQSWLYELACTLRVRTRSTQPTASSDMVSATDREVRLSVLSASITWFLAHHAAYREAYFRKHVKDAVVMNEYVAFHVVSLLLASWPLSGVSRDCASTLRSTGPSAQAIASELPR